MTDKYYFIYSCHIKRRYGLHKELKFLLQKVGQTFRFQLNRRIFAPQINQNAALGSHLIKTQATTSSYDKSYIVSQIAEQTGMEKHDVQITVEAFMRTVRDNVERGDNVYQEDLVALS